MTSSIDGARLLAATRLAQAVVLLTQPPAVLGRLQGLPPPATLRLLGMRLLLQAVAEAVRPRRGVLSFGAGVDLVHAASMLAAAAIWPRYRRAALVSAGSAGASAIAAGLLARTRR